MGLFPTCHIWRRVPIRIGQYKPYFSFLLLFFLYILQIFQFWYFCIKPVIPKWIQCFIPEKSIIINQISIFDWLSMHVHNIVQIIIESLMTISFPVSIHAISNFFLQRWLNSHFFPPQKNWIRKRAGTSMKKKSCFKYQLSK